MGNENHHSASTSNFETTPRSQPICSTGNGPVNHSDLTVVDIVSRLTSTVHTLQQSTLNKKVNNLSTQVNDAVNRVVVTQSDRSNLVRGNSTEQPQHVNVNEQSQGQGFTLATAIAALNSNQIRTMSAAAGREAQVTNMNFGSNKRKAYGYAAESLPLVETVSPNIRQTIIADDELSQTGSSSRLVFRGMHCAKRTVDEMKILVQNN